MYFCKVNSVIEGLCLICSKIIIERSDFLVYLKIFLLFMCVVICILVFYYIILFY